MQDRSSSFEALVMPYLPDAWTLARWLMKNSADADDIVQEACLKAFRSIDTCSGINPRAWLLAIVRNTALTWLQSGRIRNTVSLETLDEADRHRAEVGGDPQNTPETALIRKADAATLELAIRSLPVEFRETLVLRDIQGFDYREIAQTTGVPIGTVMSRLFRARRQMFGLLADLKSGV